MSRNYFFLTNQLNETETGVVTSIINRLETGERPNISQIAAENYVSTAFIVKMCKKLGFNGYTDLLYNLVLAQSRGSEPEHGVYGLESILDNYDDAKIACFHDYLRTFRDRKIFVVGAGFAGVTADYIAQRLSVCGFMVFNRVHFYDYMLFRNSALPHLQSNIEPSVLIAISQSGETDIVLSDVRRAKQNDFRVVSFTRMASSTLAQLSDLTFVVDSVSQALISPIPNPFFGKVILAVEELLGLFFGEQSGVSDEP